MVRKKNYGASQNSKSNWLEWNSAKFLCWNENRERPSINSKCIDCDYSFHSSPSNLCSTHPKCKLFASKRGNICLDLAKLFIKENNAKPRTTIIYSVRRHAEIESILRGRAEHGQRFERVFVVFSFCLLWQRGMAGAYVSAKHFLIIKWICTICPCLFLIMIITWVLAGI